MAKSSVVYAAPTVLECKLYGEEIASKRALVRLIEPGDKVTAMFHAGTGLNGPEFKERTGKVNRLLIFEDHVVIDLGGRHGTPGVVDASNIVSVRRAAGWDA